MKQYLKMGWRNLWRNPRRTLVVIVGGGVGVAGIIFSVGITVGMIRQIISSNLSFQTGHIKIHRIGFFKNPSIDKTFEEVSNSSVLKAIETTNGIKSYAPRIELTGLMSTSENSSGVMIVGIDPQKEKEVSVIDESIVRGKFLSPEDERKILIGKKLAEKFDLSTGDKVVIMTQGEDKEIGASAFRIKGIYRAEFSGYEKMFVFIPLSFAQKLLNLKNKITTYAITVKKVENVEEVAEKLRKKIDTGKYEVLSWKELQPILQEMVEVYDMSLYFIYVIVFIAITFVIINTVLMVVFERTREFGVLSAIGMKPLRIVLLVLAECFWLEILSILLGDALGVGLLYYFKIKGIDLTFLASGAEYWGLGRILYPELSIASLLKSDLYTLLLISIVSLYPSVRAARMNPVLALRFH